LRKAKQSTTKTATGPTTDRKISNYGAAGMVAGSVYLTCNSPVDIQPMPGI